MFLNDFNREQTEACLIARMSTAEVGPTAALALAIEAANDSIKVRLNREDGMDEIVTPSLRDALTNFQNTVFPAILTSVKGRHATEKTVRSTALATVALFDAVDRFDAILDDSFQTDEYKASVGQKEVA